MYVAKVWRQDSTKFGQVFEITLLLAKICGVCILQCYQRNAISNGWWQLNMNEVQQNCPGSSVSCGHFTLYQVCSQLWLLYLMKFMEALTFIDLVQYSQLVVAFVLNEMSWKPSLLQAWFSTVSVSIYFIETSVQIYFAGRNFAIMQQLL